MPSPPVRPFPNPFTPHSPAKGRDRSPQRSGEWFANAKAMPDRNATSLHHPFTPHSPDGCGEPSLPTDRANGPRMQKQMPSPPVRPFPNPFTPHSPAKGRDRSPQRSARMDRECKSKCQAHLSTHFQIHSPHIHPPKAGTVLRNGPANGPRMQKQMPSPPVRPFPNPFTPHSPAKGRDRSPQRSGEWFANAKANAKLTCPPISKSIHPTFARQRQGPFSATVRRMDRECKANARPQRHLIASPIHPTFTGRLRRAVPAIAHFRINHFRQFPNPHLNILISTSSTPHPKHYSLSLLTCDS
jgi:hypothetical protein